MKKPVPLNMPCPVVFGVSVVGCHFQCTMSVLETWAKAGPPSCHEYNADDSAPCSSTQVGISRDGPVGSRIGKMVGQPGFRRVRRHGRHIILNRRRIGIGHRHTTTAHRNTGRHHLLLYRIHISTTFLLVCLIQNLTYGYHGFEAAIVQAFNSRTSILPPSLTGTRPHRPAHRHVA